MKKINREIETRGKTSSHGRKNIGVMVDEQLWRNFRAHAIKEAKLSGVLLDEAIKEFLVKNDR